MQMAVFHLYYVSRRIPEAWQLGNFEDDDPTNHIPLGPSTIKYAHDWAQKKSRSQIKPGVLGKYLLLGGPDHKLYLRNIAPGPISKFAK